MAHSSYTKIILASPKKYLVILVSQHCPVSWYTYSELIWDFINKLFYPILELRTQSNQTGILSIIHSDQAHISN